jgi:invasion protein IalB
VTPANVSFPSTPRIAVEEKDSQPLDLVWRRCLPGGCFADATLKEENIRRLRSRAEPGRIEFKDGAGRDLAIPLVFRGLPQALDALARE